MAIENLGIQDGTGAADVHIQIHEGSGQHTPKFVWSTMAGLDTQESFILSVRWRGWKKGMSLPTEWRTSVIQMNASACTPFLSPYDGRYYWYAPFDCDPLILNDMNAGNANWNYDERVYDHIEMTLSCWALHTPEFAAMAGYDRSEVAYSTCHIGYFPRYKLTACYYETSELVVIEYETTWTRNDDRFCIHNPDSGDRGHSHYPGSRIMYFENQNPATGSYLLNGQTYWGTVVRKGRIEVPVEYINQHIMGRWVFLDLTFNAAYKPAGLNAIQAMGIFSVSDPTICNTPTVEIVESPDPYGIGVLVGDSGDRDAPIEYATIKVSTPDYADPEQKNAYGCAVVESYPVECGKVAYLNFLPINTPLRIDVVATSKAGGTSNLVTVFHDGIYAGDVVIFDTADDRYHDNWDKYRLVLQFNKDYKVDSAGDVETVKLAGRSRPSSFYGTGGTRSISVSGVVIDSNCKNLEDMADCGDMYARFPDGRSYRITPEISINWEHGRIREVTVLGDEVV